MENVILYHVQRQYVLKILQSTLRDEPLEYLNRCRRGKRTNAVRQFEDIGNLNRRIRTFIKASKTHLLTGCWYILNDLYTLLKDVLFVN